jgi:hypothetical protein
MSQSNYPFSESIESSSTSLFAQYGGLASAVAFTVLAPSSVASSCGTQASNALSRTVPPSSVSTLTLRPEEDIPMGVKSGGYCLPSNPVELVATVLKHNKLKADKVSELSGGNVLHEFEGEIGACVEVYPTGEIIVVIKNGDLRDLYEFTEADAGLIKGIFRHAGLCT